MTSPPWRLELLGRLRLTRHDGRAATRVLRQPKRLALLAYMVSADSGAFLRRDQIVERFWERADSRRGRASLRQGLSFLRRELGSRLVLQRGSEEVKLNAECISSDVLDFRAAWNAEDPQAALEHYGGDLLDGFVVDGSSGFEDWLEAERAVLRQQASACAWTLAERYEEAGQPRLAGFWGRKGLSLQPFDEPNAQRLISLLDRIGDRAGALRVYRGLEERLEAELGVAPSPETVKLISHVQARVSPRLEAEAAATTAFPPRRSDRDRRSGHERRSWAMAGFSGPERRSGCERRATVNRRSGLDRRSH